MTITITVDLIFAVLLTVNFVSLGMILAIKSHSIPGKWYWVDTLPMANAAAIISVISLGANAVFWKTTGAEYAEGSIFTEEAFRILMLLSIAAYIGIIVENCDRSYQRIFVLRSGEYTVCDASLENGDDTDYGQLIESKGFSVFVQDVEVTEDETLFIKAEPLPAGDDVYEAISVQSLKKRGVLAIIVNTITCFAALLTPSVFSCMLLVADRLYRVNRDPTMFVNAAFALLLIFFGSCVINWTMYSKSTSGKLANHLACILVAGVSVIGSATFQYIVGTLAL